jgi:hypothetical protein
VRHLLWPGDTSDTHLDTIVPWINENISSLEEFEARDNPRVLKTHDPAEWLDDIVAGTDAKIIFVFRNPKDQAVSFYKHMKIMPDRKEAMANVEFQDFYRDVVRNPKKFYYGLWEDHVSGYLSTRDRRNMLVLRFEDMKEDLPREIRKISEFIGVQYDEDLIEEVARKTDFNYMKQDVTCNKSFIYKSSDFFSSGKVGSWAGFLTEEQATELDLIEKNVLEKFGLI